MVVRITSERPVGQGHAEVEPQVGDDGDRIRTIDVAYGVAVVNAPNETVARCRRTRRLNVR
jgi:hypothetical protein